MQLTTVIVVQRTQTILSLKVDSIPLTYSFYVHDRALNKIYTYPPFTLVPTCNDFKPKIVYQASQLNKKALPPYINFASEIPKFSILGPVREKQEIQI